MQRSFVPSDSYSLCRIPWALRGVRFDGDLPFRCSLMFIHLFFCLCLFLFLFCFVLRIGFSLQTWLSWTYGTGCPQNAWRSSCLCLKSVCHQYLTFEPPRPPDYLFILNQPWWQEISIMNIGHFIQMQTHLFSFRFFSVINLIFKNKPKYADLPCRSHKLKYYLIQL